MQYVSILTQETICTHCGIWHSLTASGVIEPHNTRFHQKCAGSGTRPTKTIRIIPQVKVQR